MKHQEGFTVIEIALGVLIVLIVAMAVAPVFSQNLLLQDVQWDRKLATRVVETQLEKACNAAQTAAGFDADPGADQTLRVNTATLNPTPVALAPVDFPQKLTGATGERLVVCLNGDLSLANNNGSCLNDHTDTLKRVQVTVRWTSRGRDMREPSADYLISRIGACGTGAGA